VAYGGVLGQDGDALFSLQIHRVQNALLNGLADSKGSGLPKHGVNKGRLAMVDMGDNGNVP
jgi:hypothetical protein